MTPDLPPLPWADDIEAWLEVRDGAEIEAEMRAYAEKAVRLARRRELEEVALLLDAAVCRLLQPKRVNQVDAHTAAVLESKAAEIRALKDHP